MSSALKDKVVLVTGGGRGLGAAIGRAVAAEGAQLIVADLHYEAAAQTAHALEKAGHRALPVALDVGVEHNVIEVLSAVQKQYGRLDVVVNNAGTDVTLPLSEISTEQWERVIRTNLHGPFLLSKHAQPLLRASRGHIVNIASTAAKRAWPNAAAYHASKWGVLGLSHALHAELRSEGIKVTAVVAGGMRTPFLLDRFPDLDPELLQAPENVAQAVVFVLGMPDESVIPEITVLPMRETSWP